MIYLFVGDIHATQDSLEECQKLFDFIELTFDAMTNPKKKLVFLGDLHHSHGVIRLEVLSFYLNNFQRLGEKYGAENVILLSGNHDMNHGTESVVEAYRSYVSVITAPVLLGPDLFMPYVASPADFVKAVRANGGIRFLVCHQSFLGAKLENGYPVPDGVDVNQIKENVDLIIAGHIHLHQELELEGKMKVLYTGNPRFLTKSDANQVKCLVSVDGAKNITQYPIPSTIVRPIQSFTLDLSQTMGLPPIDPLAKVFVNISGTKDQVKEFMLSDIDMTNFNLSVNYVDDNQKVTVKESDGLRVSLEKFIKNKQWDIPSEALWGELVQRMSFLKQ